MKIRPVGGELFHAGRRTDMTKLIDAFRNFANVPNKRWNRPWGSHMTGKWLVYCITSRQ